MKKKLLEIKDLSVSFDLYEGKTIAIVGESGCKFVGRCPKAMDICKSERLELSELKEGHFVACHLYD
jgi:oligopeptide/dipeptide ABC transporter ATP-binding protein